MGKDHKFYMDEDDFKKLMDTVKDAGFIGKGSLSRYLRNLAHEPSIILTKNMRDLLQAMKLTLK